MAEGFEPPAVPSDRSVPPPPPPSTGIGHFLGASTNDPSAGESTPTLPPTGGQAEIGAVLAARDPFAVTDHGGPVLGSRFDQPAEYQPHVLGRSHVVEVPEPVPLRHARWPRWLFVLGACISPFGQALASLPDDTDTELAPALVWAGVAASLLLPLAVMSWTWLNVDNSRRLLAHSRRTSSISPVRAIFWWLAPALVGAPLFAFVLWVDREILDRSATASDDDLILGFMVLGLVLLMLVLWFRPYAYLSAVAKRVHSESSLFLRWFWMPIAMTLVSFIFAFVLSIAGAFQRDELERWVFFALVIAFLSLPYLTWVLTGWRAMTNLEQILRARAASQRTQRDLFLATERPVTGPATPGR